MVLVKDAFLGEFGSTVKCCLTTESQQNTVWAFLLDDFFSEFRCNRKEIGFSPTNFSSVCIVATLGLINTTSMPSSFTAFIAWAPE